MHTPLNLYTKGRKGVQSVSKQVFSFDIECREDSKFMPRGKSHRLHQKSRMRQRSGFLLLTFSLFTLHLPAHSGFLESKKS